MNCYNKTKNITEYLVIKELYKDPRISITSIAKNIGKTRQTVSNALKRIFEQDKINIILGINKHHYKIKFINVKLKIKKTLDTKYFTKLFSKCPRVFSILEFVSLNTLEILICFENTSNQNHLAYPCPNLINKICNDPRISEVVIDPFWNLITPKFISMKKYNSNKKYKNTHCGHLCTKCPNYSNLCNGCPGTIFYKSKFFL